jgi:hypothetical protein
MHSRLYLRGWARATPAMESPMSMSWEAVLSSALRHQRLGQNRLARNSIQTKDRAQMSMSLQLPPKTTPRKWSGFRTCQDDKTGHIPLRVLRTTGAMVFASASRLHDMDTADSDIVTSKFTRGGWAMSESVVSTSLLYEESAL